MKKKKKTGPKPRPKGHQAEPKRVPVVLWPKVDEIITEWKKEHGYK